MTDDEFEKFSDGKTPPADENKEGAGADNETPEAKEKREAAETEAKKKSDDEAEAAKKKADEEAAAAGQAKKNEEAGADEETEEDDEDKNKNKGGEDKTPHVPYSKFKKEKSKWEEREKQLTEELNLTKKQKEALEQAVSSKNIEQDVDKFIEETGMEKDAVMGLINIIKKHSGVSPDVEKRITNFEKTSAEAAEKAAFENDFNENVIPLLKEANADITSAQIAKAKEKIKELAYQKGNEKIPLDYIFARHQRDLSGLIAKPEKKKSAEGSRPGSQSGVKPVEYENITSEQIRDMSDSEFEKYSVWAEKNSGSALKIMRKGEQINSNS